MPAVLSVEAVFQRPAAEVVDVIGTLVEGDVVPGELLRLNFEELPLVAGLHVRSFDRLPDGRTKLTVDTSLFKDAPPIEQWPLLGSLVETYQP